MTFFYSPAITNNLILNIKFQLLYRMHVSIKPVIHDHTMHTIYMYALKVEYTMYMNTLAVYICIIELKFCEKQLYQSIAFTRLSSSRGVGVGALLIVSSTGICTCMCHVNTPVLSHFTLNLPCKKPVLLS